MFATIAIIALIIGFTTYYFTSGHFVNAAALSPKEQQMIFTAENEKGTIQSPLYKAAQFKIDKSQFKRAPDFTKITGYVNTATPIKISDLKGKVVLVHFWTYTCANCINTIPYLNDWYKKYANMGLVIIGVQTPEFDFEKNIDNVKEAVKQYAIKYPVLQDNDYGTWNAYGNRYWPRDYLIDNQGLIRYNHVGEGGYDQTEKTIQSLIAEGIS